MQQPFLCRTIYIFIEMWHLWNKRAINTWKHLNPSMSYAINTCRKFHPNVTVFWQAYNSRAKWKTCYEILHIFIQLFPFGQTIWKFKPQRVQITSLDSGFGSLVTLVSIQQLISERSEHIRPISHSRNDAHIWKLEVKKLPKKTIFIWMQFQ